MKKIVLIIILPLITLLYSCGTSEEASTDNSVTLIQMQQWQEEQASRQEKGEQSGLVQEEMQRLDDYARRKADLDCQLFELDKSASGALSDAAQKQIKESVIKLDDETNTLGREIDQYCNTDARQRYYQHMYKHYKKACE